MEEDLIVSLGKLNSLLLVKKTLEGDDLIQKYLTNNLLHNI